MLRVANCTPLFFPLHWFHCLKPGLTGSFDERELWFPCGLCKVGVDHVTDVNHVPSAECDKLLWLLVRKFGRDGDDMWERTCLNCWCNQALEAASRCSCAGSILENFRCEWRVWISPHLCSSWRTTSFDILLLLMKWFHWRFRIIWHLSISFCLPSWALFLLHSCQIFVAWTDLTLLGIQNKEKFFASMAASAIPSIPWMTCEGFQNPSRCGVVTGSDGSWNV